MGKIVGAVGMVP